jgi:hypothetical protein
MRADLAPGGTFPDYEVRDHSLEQEATHEYDND